MTDGSQIFTTAQPGSRQPQDMPYEDLPSKVSGRVRHIFRESLHKGQIHPLYLPMLRYRHAQWLGACEAIVGQGAGNPGCDLEAATIGPLHRDGVQDLTARPNTHLATQPRGRRWPF